MKISCQISDREVSKVSSPIFPILYSFIDFILFFFFGKIMIVETNWIFHEAKFISMIKTVVNLGSQT